MNEERLDLLQKPRLRKIAQKVIRRISEKDPSFAAKYVGSTMIVEREALKGIKIPDYGGAAYASRVAGRHGIVLSATRLQRHSDKAIMGMIAHEFGHIKNQNWIDPGEEIKYSDLLRNLASEDEADKTAEQWGFEKEVRQYRKEEARDLDPMTQDLMRRFGNLPAAEMLAKMRSEFGLTKKQCVEVFKGILGRRAIRLNMNRRK